MDSQILKNISREEFREKLNLGEHILIDVRTQEEHNKEKIADSEVIDITLSDFAERIGVLDKGKKYLIYCHSGGRSGQAMEAMSQMGFREVLNLEGGLMNY